MKCPNCGKVTTNTISGNYTCDNCGFAMNDPSGLGIDWTKQDSISTPRVSDNITRFPNTSDQAFIRQGWQCPKCGAILSPDMSWCPFCSGHGTPNIITCGGSLLSGEFVNPNVTTAISNTTKKSGDV